MFKKELPNFLWFSTLKYEEQKKDFIIRAVGLALLFVFTIFVELFWFID